MLREQRLKVIMNALASAETVPLVELARLCSASEMTVRRDLADLEARGRLRRVRGGASLVPPESDPGYWHRSTLKHESKQALGKLAASLVRDGQTVFLDAGTTMTEVARAIAAKSAAELLNVRIVTHAVNISAELAAVPSIAVHQLGGEIDSGTLSAVGHDMGQQMSDMNFDLFFMGATGVSLANGCTNSAPRGIEVKRAALAQARHTWLVADASKWNATSAYKIIDLAALDGWITDVEFDEEGLQSIAKEGVELKLVAD